MKPAHDQLCIGLERETKKPFCIPRSRMATKKLAFVGVSGSGKTHNSAVIVEQMIAHNLLPIIFDPIGRWWDLGVSADGRGQGLPLAIIGGKRGQYDLTPDMGAAIADFVATYRIPTVIDLSRLGSKAQWRQIIQDFGNRLFEVNTHPINLVIEEAPEFVPQKVVESVAGVYGVMSRIALLGRNNGIGFTLLGQRTQSINKDVLSQVNALFIMRMTDPGGVEAARDWLVSQGAPTEMLDQVRKDLPYLDDGEAYVLSPVWLKTFARVQFNRRTTFHYDAEDDEAQDFTGEVARSIDSRKITDFFDAHLTKTEGQTKRSAHPAHSDDGQLRQLRAENSTLRTTLDQLQATAISEEEVAERLRMATESATRETNLRVAALTQTIAQVAQVLQASIGGVDGNPVAPAQVFAPINRIKKLEMQVEENPRIGGSAKKIFRMLVAEYPDFPQGISKAKLASLCKVKVTSGGGFNQPLADLKARRCVVIEGTGDSAIVSINPAML